ncbi:hypothetical protein JL722_10959 [Aureococcus anophagefferens]|nr:hypothetical protein JL722_10959 [Aureococcus anophagefferens]
MSNADGHDWRAKKKEYEEVNAEERALRASCSVCGEKAKLNCPCGITQYCDLDCQRKDWKERGHRAVCKKIQAEKKKAAEPEAPAPVFGPPRSAVDDIRARIKARDEAARERKEAELDASTATRARSATRRRRDHAASLARLERLARKDVPEALNVLATAHRDGLLGEQDDRKAVKFYRRAAKRGSLQAATSLGYLMTKGRGTKQDLYEAMAVWHEAAKKGCAQAQCNLGAELYHDAERGRFNAGVTRDKVEDTFREAVYWITLAAEQDHQMGIYCVAMLFMKGLTPHLSEDRVWLEDKKYHIYAACVAAALFYAGRYVGLGLDVAAWPAAVSAWLDGARAAPAARARDPRRWAASASSSSPNSGPRRPHIIRTRAVRRAAPACCRIRRQDLLT